MLHLQEKAHFSLEEFRRGKGSPMARFNPSSPTTPDGDDDELNVLGGKTRLVTKKEPSSPVLMDRSPVSQNPIVPLPLSPGLHNQLPPSVREYLDSFKVQGHQEHTVYQEQVTSNHGSFSSSLNGHGPYSESSISPVSMFGMSTLQTSYPNDQTSYMGQQPMQDVMQSQSSAMGSHQSAMDASGSQNDSNFPQYFPVYDYGLASTSNANGNVFSHEHTLLVDNSPQPVQRRASGSPDSNMQATWLDFVNTMAMQP